MYKLVIFLKDDEADALQELAQTEYRDIRSQAAFILKEELVRRHFFTSGSDLNRNSELVKQVQGLANPKIKEEDHG